MRKEKTKGYSKKPTKQRAKNINSYGYDVSKFFVLDIPVRRDRETGRLISTNQQSLKKRG